MVPKTTRARPITSRHYPRHPLCRPSVSFGWRLFRRHLRSSTIASDADKPHRLDGLRRSAPFADGKRDNLLISWPTDRSLKQGGLVDKVLTRLGPCFPNSVSFGTHASNVSLHRSRKGEQNAEQRSRSGGHATLIINGRLMISP